MEHLRVLYLFVILFGITSDRHMYVGAICGAHFNSSTGVVLSPNYPNAYPNNAVCEWIIRDPNKQPLVLHVEKFLTEQDRDLLEIRNGDSATSPLVGKYSGTVIPVDFANLSYQIYMKYTTDHSVAHQGFNISWGSATGTGIFNNESRIHGGFFTSLSGIITSPNYPENYPENVEREWIIQVPRGYVVTLNVKKFDVEPHAQCESEYLEIRSGNSAAALTLLEKYCGRNVPEKIMCNGNRVHMQFKTDGSNNHDFGFLIEWNATALDAGFCGGNLTASHGSISSPHYPEPFSSLVKCNWNIRVSAGSAIQFILADLEFEAVDQCRFDFIEIYEGSSTRGKSLGTYCQTINHPMYIETTSNVASVQFRSDSSTSGRRFRILYHTICRNKFRGVEGAIESPDFPNNYPHRENCSWIIEAPTGKTLNLTFIKFNLEGGPENSCSNDYLEIAEGEDDEPSRKIGRFCSSREPPAVIVTTKHQVFLQFNSDSADSEKGFRLEWVVGGLECDAPSKEEGIKANDWSPDSQINLNSSSTCGGHFNSSTGIIMSPDYAERYPVNTVCEWIIEDPNKQRMVLNFEKFDIEQCESCRCDYLEIRNGDSSTSPLLGTYCGTTIPANILSFGYQIYLKFETDSSRSHQGFSLAWGSAVVDVSDEMSRTHGGYFDSSSGVIVSPNYPGDYPENLERKWIIEVPKGHVVVLNVKKFNVQPHAQCESDYLEIRNGSSVATSTLVGKYCGSRIPKKIQCHGDRIFLRFKTDDSLSYQGFVIEWNSTALDCGGILTTSRGSISSPYYPELYSLPVECNWNIQVSAGSVIQLILVDLEFEAAEQCRFDFIELFDGSDTRGEKLGTYCETMNRPLYVETTSNVASVRFRSDLTNSGRRFRIIYYTICHNKLHGSEGVIESPNYPNNYPHRENCTWVIEVPPGKNLQLTFSEFDLDGGPENSCNDDYLKITEGERDEPTREIGKFCNPISPPPTIITTQRQVFLQFNSDDSTSRNGFRLEWVINVHNTTALPLPPACLLWSQSVARRNDYIYTLGTVGHKLHTRGVTWNEARITCQREGGHLAIINSITELNTIIELFRNSDVITESPSPNLASIGFHFLYSEGQFATIHDQSLTEAGFAKWGSGQPDNSTGSEYCGALSITGELNDISCETKYGFICKILGSAAFGIVRKAEARSICRGEPVTTVAVKLVRGTASLNFITALTRELKILIHLGKHTNVVNLLGACTKDVSWGELLVIVEYCRFGNLHDYLVRQRADFVDETHSEIVEVGSDLDDVNDEELNPKKADCGKSSATDNDDHGPNLTSDSVAKDDHVLEDDSGDARGLRSKYEGDYMEMNLKPIRTRDLVHWIWQVSRGMEYLGKRKVVHGDLAARNILLADKGIVKICHFGLAKALYEEAQYRNRGEDPLPVKWMAVEATKDRVFSFQSDVWSFGIVMCREFFTLARTPYPGIRSRDLYCELANGHRIGKPEYASWAIYKTMLECWETDPAKRPSFTELEEILGDSLDEDFKTVN